MNKLNIIYLQPGALKPYVKNAKKHPADQVERIANSIREFGFRQPIVVDAENTVIIGHGRLLAAKKLRLDVVPCVRADDLTEDQIRALRLADNKTGESEWDTGSLEMELADINIDMGDFGFDIQDNTETEPKAVTIQPYTKVHYLLTVDINDHDKIVDEIETLRNTGYVTIDSASK